jgi:hypothetical protein
VLGKIYRNTAGRRRVFTRLTAGWVEHRVAVGEKGIEFLVYPNEVGAYETLNSFFAINHSRLNQVRIYQLTTKTGIIVFDEVSSKWAGCCVISHRTTEKSS